MSFRCISKLKPGDTVVFTSNYGHILITDIIYSWNPYWGSWETNKGYLMNKSKSYRRIIKAK